MTQLSSPLTDHLDTLGDTVGGAVSASTAMSTTGLASLTTPVVIGAAVFTGLQAGTYFTWVVGVMPGLRHVDDRTFVSAMQSVNVSIVNPVFMLSFFGAPLLALTVALLTHGSARRLAVVATALAVATVLITVAGNVPLNDALAAAGPVDRIRDLHAVRARFEDLWTGLNIARTLTATGALGCLALVALRAGRAA